MFIGFWNWKRLCMKWRRIWLKLKIYWLNIECSNCALIHVRIRFQDISYCSFVKCFIVLTDIQSALPTWVTPTVNLTKDGLATINRPHVVQQYNEHMGGVDLADVFMSRRILWGFTGGGSECSSTYWTWELPTQ